MKQPFVATGSRPTAVFRVDDLDVSNVNEAVGYLRAIAERKSHKSRVPVSRRSCVPAIDRGCVKTPPVAPSDP